MQKAKSGSFRVNCPKRVEKISIQLKENKSYPLDELSFKKDKNDTRGRFFGFVGPIRIQKRPNKWRFPDDCPFKVESF